MLPSLFVSHGAPDLLLHPTVPAHRFLAGLAGTMPRPRAVVVISAHWQGEVPLVDTSPRPTTIHDFGGFPAALFEMRYPAPGDPSLAARVLDLLRDWSPRGQQRGLDHGAWAPLRLAFPDAELPVVQLSLLHRGSPTDHLDLGRALAPLRADQVLILGSGSATHNLGELSAGDAPGWATTFDDWLAERLAAGASDDLCDYRRLAPQATRCHPTEEHLLPLFVALGAAGAHAGGRPLHRSFTYGSLSMAAYAFAD